MKIKVEAIPNYFDENSTLYHYAVEQFCCERIQAAMEIQYSVIALDEYAQEKIGKPGICLRNECNEEFFFDFCPFCAEEIKMETA